MAKAPTLSIRLKTDLRAIIQRIAVRENRSLGNVIETTLRNSSIVKAELERESSKKVARR